MKMTAAALLLLTASPASAHAFLKFADPPVGSQGPAPSQIVLTFTEGVEPAFSSIAVLNAGGQRVDKNDAHAERSETKLAVSVPSLPPGTYRVEWHAVSVDTHRTEGTFAFTVAR